MAQIWINSEDRYLSARMVISKQKSTVGYLLVPGLFEPSCDLFYFFQEFIEEIKVNDKCGLVFEFCGTGDSFGEITSVTISTMLQNLEDTLNYMKSQGIKEIIAVGRGTGANILNAIAADEAIKAIYMINPMMLGDNATHILTEFLVKNSVENICLFETVLKELQSLLYTGGVDMSNIEEDIASLQLFREMRDINIFTQDFSLSNKSKIIITKDMLGRYVDDVGNYAIEADFANYNDRYNIIKNIISYE